MDRFARAKKRKSTDIRNDQREKGAFPIRMFFPEDRDAAIMAGSENHAAWRNPANEAVATPDSFAPVSETVSEFLLLTISSSTCNAPLIDLSSLQLCCRTIQPTFGVLSEWHRKASS
jgi:hypothetical protein